MSIREINEADLKKVGLRVATDYTKYLIPQNVEIPKPDSVLDLNGEPLFTKKSLSLVIAKAKAGKTTAVAYLVAQMLKDCVSVLWFDTEQGGYYGSRTQHWVLSIAFIDQTDCLKYFDLKTLSPSERIEAIEQILYTYPVEVVVIDGVRDLLSDINSPDQSTEVLTYLMKWCEEYNCHIINILHTNKGDNNARGHLGSELVNKAEITLKVETNIDEQIIVTPENSRSLKPQSFALSRKEKGIPYLLSGWIEPEITKSKKKKPEPYQIDLDTHNSVLSKVFENESKMNATNFHTDFTIAYNTLGEVETDKMSVNRARSFLEYYVENKFLITEKGPKNNELLHSLNTKKGECFVN